MKKMSYYFFMAVLGIAFTVIMMAALGCENNPISEAANAANQVTVIIHGVSMEPTLENGEQITAEIIDGADTIERGTVAAFPFDVVRERFELDENAVYGTLCIKRVIGLPGDTLRYDESTATLYINGEEYAEPYIMDQNYEWGIGEIVVPDGCVFMMGDNRNHSIDSRIFGCVEMDSLTRVFDIQ